MIRHQHKRGSTSKKFSIRISVLLVGVLLFLQACASQESKEASGKETDGGIPSVLNYGYIGVNQLNSPRAAEGWGLHKGIIQEELKKHGITEIKLYGFPNGPDLNESLISGRLDIGSLGDTPAILARSSGAKTRLITQASTDNIGYLIGKKGLKDIKELQGKTIAIQKGSFMHRYVVGLLKKEGITNYKLIHMLRPDGEAALARGEVDAMTNSGVNALKLIDQGFSHLDDATKHPELLGTNATVVSEAYLKKFPDFPKIWNEARSKALQDLKKHPEEYYQFIAKIQNSTPEFVKKTEPIENIKNEPFTDQGTKLLEGTKKFLVEEKLVEKDFEIKEWILK